MEIVRRAKRILWSVIAAAILMVATITVCFFLTSAEIHQTYLDNYEILKSQGLDNLLASPSVVGERFFLLYSLVALFGIGLIMPFVWYIIRGVVDLKEFYQTAMVADMLTSAVALDRTGIMIVKPDTHKIMYANASVVDHFGYSTYREIINHPVTDIIQVPHFGQFVEILKSDHPEGTEVKFNVKFGNGEWAETEMSIFPVFDVEGHPDYVHFMVYCPSKCPPCSAEDVPPVESAAESVSKMVASVASVRMFKPL